MYQFPAEARKALEAMPLPIAYYQGKGDGIIALLVSDGLCKMMGADRENLISLLNSSLLERIHPDDVGRIARIIREFANHLCGYDVIYRGKYSQNDDYHYIHSIGRFQAAPDGTELAIFAYTDMSESQSESNVLVENYTLFQKDQFYSDSVTGLPNINYIHEFADEKVSKIRACERTAALVYFDVKGLRSYNNQYGYERGDELLRLIADVLKDEYPNALLGRGADDHFILITDLTSAETLSAKVESINQKVKTGAYGNTMGIQAGICLYDESMVTTSALENARHALKNIGNDLNRTFALYTHEVDDRYWEQQYILESFNNALEHEWIKIYYQAIMRVKTGKAAALEALARWVDPVRGIISPGEFIPVLEKYHLLYKLDLYMVKQFLKEYPERIKVGLPIIPVSINFSAQDFDHADIVGTLNEMFERSGIGKENIIIEITEQDVAAASERFKQQLLDLRANGYRLWLDDFGSGYSSLNMLSQYDVDVLKIDLEFLRHLDDHNGANRHIMKATVDVANKMGIRTLAEGMETEEHLKFLREIGCEFAQGFYYYKPESLASITFKKHKGKAFIACENPEERKALRDEWRRESHRIRVGDIYMTHQDFVNHVDFPCCVISVQKGEPYGEIRIVCANTAYKSIMGPAYYDNMIYSELVPQDNKFEDYCYRAAILKQKMHAYVETKALHCWTDQTLTPLASDRSDMGYCQFIFEFTQEAEADRMANVSVNTAETVIKACIKLMGAADFNSGAGDVLDIIMETSSANASRILLVDHEKKAISMLCERTTADTQIHADALSYDLVQSWEGMIGDSNAVIVQNDSDLAALGEKNHAWAQSMRENQINTLVLIPLRREKQVVGYMYVINFDVEKVVEVKEVIELMSFFLGSEIYNHVLLQKLEELSQIDVLTGVKNRRAMLNRMREITDRRADIPYGVINIDLNGLKAVNDNEGHEAGDRLIIQAGEIFRKVFYQDDVFRTGGDEFIIITSDIDQETFENKMMRLRADVEKNSVSCAIGSFWSDGSVDMKTAYRNADETMYADKKTFYDRHPELKRK